MQKYTCIEKVKSNNKIAKYVLMSELNTLIELTPKELVAKMQSGEIYVHNLKCSKRGNIIAKNTVKYRSTKRDSYGTTLNEDWLKNIARDAFEQLLDRQWVRLNELKQLSVNSKYDICRAFNLIGEPLIIKNNGCNNVAYIGLRYLIKTQILSIYIIVMGKDNRLRQKYETYADSIDSKDIYKMVRHFVGESISHIVL